MTDGYTAKELREAAGIILSGNPRDDAKSVAIYVMKALRDDDDLPVDVPWLGGLRQVGGDMSMVCVRLVNGRYHLMAPGRVTEGVCGMLDYVSPKPATRGDVRRLCSALGVVLSEQEITA